MIEVFGLEVHRGRRILGPLDLTLRPGEVTVLVGPNGSGKSTLLAALSGSLPYRGSVRIAGQEVRATPPAALARLRAVMAQETSLAFPFRVAEVVALGAPGAREARIAQLLAELGLAGFGPRDAMALSGGEAQRMHLARALMQAEGQGGRWLFLDEPVSSLDLAHQVAVMERARAFARAGGGVLAVLHDLNLAARVADRLAVLKAGSLLAVGPPAEVMTEAMIDVVFGARVALNTAPPGPWFAIQTVQNP